MDAIRSFLTCTQQPGQSPAAYLDDLRGWTVTITQQGGTIAFNPKLFAATGADGRELSDEDRRAKAYEKTLAIALITGADPTKFGTLTAHLSNQYAAGYDEYPSDVAGAYNLLVNYRSPENLPRPRSAHQSAPVTSSTATVGTSSGITFAKSGTVPGSNGLTHDEIECYNCHSIGHYASNCPDGTVSPSGTTLIQFAYMMAQANGLCIDPAWILLDSQSTISVFNNAAMLSNVQKSKHTLRTLTNGGHQDSGMVGTFNNLGNVWYNPALRAK